MKSFVCIFTILLMMCSSGFAQKKRDINTPVTVGYCLPKTGFLVKVKVEHIQQLPGPYAQYAEQKLGIRPEIDRPGERWRLLDVSIYPQAVPDEKAMYSLTTTVDYNPIMLALSPEGFLAGVATSPGILLENGKKVYYDAFRDVQGNMVDITELSVYNPLKEILDTNYTIQEIDGVEKRIWDPIIRYAVKSERESMEEAAKEILRIRSERSRLLALEGELPDGKYLELMLAEFDRMEKEYVSLFMGGEYTQVMEKSFLCVPEKAGEPVVAFRFSETEGFVERNKNSVPAYLLVAQDIVIPGASNEKDASESQAAIFYRVPAVGTVKFLRVTQELQSFQAVLPQLGVIRAFPTEVISNEGLSLDFYSEYGSLKSINKK
ncbi:MAG: DUF4831 family protein [Odoribacter sp.]|nr:DUF4831 family protein [Odoribacter sp.]